MGLGLIRAASQTVFSAVKIAGAVYLAWPGIKLLRSAPASQALEAGGSSVTPAQAFRRESLVTLGNPKAILIFAAFFPQFIVAERYWESYLLVGGLFLVLGTRRDRGLRIGWQRHGACGPQAALLVPARLRRGHDGFRGIAALDAPSG